ncbi:sortase B protein-sorting domain-containing protein [Patescibacteria group bacterium]|nr:sortase B protein-sorting domain-containing protein [Patescibacteria group bacterium]
MKFSSEIGLYAILLIAAAILLSLKKVLTLYGAPVAE